MSRLSTRIEEAIVLVLVLSATAVAVTHTDQPTISKNRTVPVVRSATRTAVFVPVRQGDSVKLVEQTLSVPGNVDPRVAAIDYLARPGGVLPRGTTVRNLSQNDRVLSIDFSQEIKRFRGGSSDEALLLAALSATVSQFQGVSAFQITVQDKPLTTLGGHADLSEPYPASKILPEDFR